MIPVDINKINVSDYWDTIVFTEEQKGKISICMDFMDKMDKMDKMHDVTGGYETAYTN